MALIRKTVSLPEETWEKIDDYRFQNRIRRESDAIRDLIEAGWEARRNQPAVTGKKNTGGTAEAATGSSGPHKASPEAGSANVSGKPSRRPPSATQ